MRGAASGSTWCQSVGGLSAERAGVSRVRYGIFAVAAGELAELVVLHVDRDFELIAEIESRLDTLDTAARRHEATLEAAADSAEPPDPAVMEASAATLGAWNDVLWSLRQDSHADCDADHECCNHRS